jgi:signal transduction histidine kinase
MMIRLKHRLVLTYAVFTGAALAALILVINSVTGAVFSGFVKNTIQERSGEIVRVIGSQYDPFMGGFDMAAIETMGMLFVHEGYILSVEDAEGNPVWDARSCDMERCSEVIKEIANRMEGRRIRGALQIQRYALPYHDRIAGYVDIETYGPYFYSEAEDDFLVSINRVLMAAGAALILFSVVVSFFIAGSIAGPVLKASSAARRIARLHSAGFSAGRYGGSEKVRVRENYKTRELADLSGSINELAAELEEGERRQRQLTQDVAHELRTPLTCLQGNIEAMIDGVWEPSPGRLKSCHEEIIRLSSLVEDLRVLTSLEWENVSLEKTDFDPAAMLRLTAEQFSAAAMEKGLEVILDLEEGSLNADYSRLKQVFVNLVSNAVQYTESGKVTVRCRRLDGDKAGARWEMSVADTGVGMNSAEVSRVFERFYRSDRSRSRNSGGAGIGLAIAEAIVRAHGGVIAAESEPGKGSVFTVRLPVTP